MNTLQLPERPSKGYRCWRLTLQILLLAALIGIIGLLAAWIIFHRAFAHGAAVSRIERYLGDISYLAEKDEPARNTQFRRWFGKKYFGHIICIRANPFGSFPLEELASLPEVQQLELTGTRLDPAKLVHLHRLPRLQILNLRGTNVTDADIAHLEGLTHLEWLDLSYTSISDAGLKHLKSLKSLTLLRLEGTRVSEEGKKRLSTELPRCKIHLH